MSRGCYKENASDFPVSLSVSRVVLKTPRVRHARLVGDMLATRLTILTYRDGLTVANILVAFMSDTSDFLVTC